MSPITFETTLFKINNWIILQLPKEESMKLPSRGMVLVTGTLNNTPFKTVLEPDGRGSHWFKVDNNLLKSTKVNEGKTVTVTMEPSQEWPEPTLPADLKKALSDDPKAKSIWDDITPMARWDWIRWIRSTNNEDTRKKHIVVAFSKLKKGTRRPCCFNRSMCTEMEVSKGGLLLAPQL